MMHIIRTVEAARGDGVKAPRPAEVPLAALARRSLHASRDLAVGEIVRANDLVALRPATGLAPSKMASVVGRRLTAAVSQGDVLTEAHLQ